MKKTINGFLYEVMYSWQKEPNYVVLSNDRMGDLDNHLIGAISFEAQIPDDFDPRPGMVKSLQKEKENILAECNKQIVRIDRRIGELLAIENKVAP